jgi:hypothetical protein
LNSREQTVIITRIIGGLGNQLFQYAAAYALARKTNSVMKLDIRGYKSQVRRKFELHRLNIAYELAAAQEIEKLMYKTEQKAVRWVRKLSKRPRPHAASFLREPHFQFSATIFDPDQSAYLDGYWQSEKYFLEYREDLLRRFTLKHQFSTQAQAYLHNIQQSQSVGLHIRRGDYVSDPQTQKVHGKCPIEYYQHAIALIQEKVTRPHFFVFSDDLHWAKANLGFLDHLTFVEFDDPDSACVELMLMSRCQHNIIANSSFSWWAAWLNPGSQKMVIAPRQWFVEPSFNTRDLLPASWMQL